jgi:hypothetical protein
MSNISGVPRQGTTKDHNAKKNPHMAEVFAAKRRAKNAERPKQHWVGLLGGIDVKHTKGEWVR